MPKKTLTANQPLFTVSRRNAILSEEVEIKSYSSSAALFALDESSAKQEKVLDALKKVDEVDIQPTAKVEAEDIQKVLDKVPRLTEACLSVPVEPKPKKNIKKVVVKEASVGRRASALPLKSTGSKPSLSTTKGNTNNTNIRQTGHDTNAQMISEEIQLDKFQVREVKSKDVDGRKIKNDRM